MKKFYPSMARHRNRRGAVLVEFAIVAFLAYLIIAAIFTFGRALFVAQSLQQTADLFAHELARTPLPPNATLADALQDSSVRQTLFDENALEIDITPWMRNDGGLSLDQYLQQRNVPLVNRMLTPLMIVDEHSDGTTVLGYPGAARGADGRYYVSVLKGDGTTPPTAVPVIEAAGSPDPFPLGMVGTSAASSPPMTGLATVRINYPFQSASLSAFTYSVNGAPVQSPLGQTGVQGNFIETNEPLDVGPTRGGLYGGPDHLGQQVVGSKIVRPFQRLISAQAVYRREIFAAEPPAAP